MFKTLVKVIKKVSLINENGPEKIIKKLDHNLPYLRSPPYEI